MKSLIKIQAALLLSTTLLTAQQPTTPESPALKPTAITQAVKSNKKDEALKIAQQLIEEKQDIADALFKSATTYIAKQQLENAIPFFQLLIKNFPNSPKTSPARAELLGCYYNLRQLEKSISQAQANLLAEPKSKWTEYWSFVIAQSNFRLWKFKKGETLLKEFLTKYPSGQYSKFAKRALAKINPNYVTNSDGLVKYNGRLKDDIRLQAAINSLPQDIENGYKTLKKRLGVDLPKDTKILYYFEDEKYGKKSGVKASTYTVAIDYKPVVLMRFYTAFVASQTTSYRYTVTHELKHAGFRVLMGQNYDNLPAWIKEGLAVYGADDVQTRLQSVLCNQISGGKDPMTTLNGIDNTKHTTTDYMESSLAFEWLESKKTGNVKAFCQAIIKGQHYKKIWAELAGTTYKQAITEANNYCTQRVKSEIGTSLASFQELHKAYQKALKQNPTTLKNWLDHGGRKKFNQWLIDNPQHPATPFARFSLAHASIQSGDGETGRKQLKHILKHDSMRCSLLDDAQLWIALSYHYAKNTANAKQEFGILIRDFPASHSARQVTGKFPPAPPITKQKQTPKSKLTTWFETSIKGKNKTFPAHTNHNKNLNALRKTALQAYKAATTNLGKQNKFTLLNDFTKGITKNPKIKTSKFNIAKGLNMPYCVVKRGKRPTNGWPLAICMHGGGGTGDKLPHPHAWPMNTKEWHTQIKFSLQVYPDNMIYFIPRMVDDNQGRWWKEFNHTAYTEMIRHAVLYWDVDPNRIYMLGISEGGYGTETLACRYPTPYAAANGMACGSGTSIHTENLRNLPFRTDVGEKDTSFNRYPNAVIKHQMLADYRMEDPSGYLHHLEIHKGRGHGIDYRKGPKWLIDKTRNPHPHRITFTLFQHDGIKNKGAYWIEAINDLNKKIIKLDANIDTKNNTIHIAATASIKDEAVQSADWQQPLNDPGDFTTAKGLKLRLWLHEKLLNLNKPINIRINGKKLPPISVSPSLETMSKSLIHFGDPERIYPAHTDITVP